MSVAQFKDVLGRKKTLFANLRTLPIVQQVHLQFTQASTHVKFAKQLAFF